MTPPSPSTTAAAQPPQWWAGWVGLAGTCTQSALETTLHKVQYTAAQQELLLTTQSVKKKSMHTTLASASAKKKGGSEIYYLHSLVFIYFILHNRMIKNPNPNNE